MRDLSEAEGLPSLTPRGVSPDDWLGHQDSNSRGGSIELSKGMLLISWTVLPSWRPAVPCWVVVAVYS